MALESQQVFQVIPGPRLSEDMHGAGPFTTTVHGVGPFYSPTNSKQHYEH